MVGDFVATFEVNNSPIYMCCFLILEGLLNIHGLCPSIVDTVLMSYFLASYCNIMSTNLKSELCFAGFAGLN